MRANGQCSFSIGQKYERNILLSIRAFVGTSAGVAQRANAGMFFVLETYNRASLLCLIAHFNQYPLLGEKAKQLASFSLHVLPQHPL